MPWSTLMARGVSDLLLLVFQISIYLMGSPVGYEMIHLRWFCHCQSHSAAHGSPSFLSLLHVDRGLFAVGQHSLWFHVHNEECFTSYLSD